MPPKTTIARKQKRPSVTDTMSSPAEKILSRVLPGGVLATMGRGEDCGGIHTAHLHARDNQHSSRPLAEQN
eukprot:2454818-Prymnesium_polylepis.1